MDDNRAMIEASAHKSLRSLVQAIRDATGLQINSVSFQWISTARIDQPSAALVEVSNMDITLIGPGMPSQPVA